MQDGSNPNNEGQPKPLNPSFKTQNLRVYKIILIIEIAIIAVLAIAIILVKIFYHTPSNPTQASDFSICKHRTKEEILNLTSNITKDEAISIIENINGENKCTPEGLLPEKLKLKSNEFAQKILYSYDDVAEVPSIAQSSVMGGNGLFTDRKSTDDFLIDETTEYYTIVSVDNSKIPCGELDESQSTITCYRGISFNRKYLNHYEKIEGTSHNDEMIFNDLSTDFVELALKVIMATDIWNSNSLFDYYFEDNGDSFTLTGIYFGVGIDMNNLEGATAFNIPYAINVYEKKLSLDKNTKKVAWEKYDSIYDGESSSNILKSFSLSNDELLEIQAAIYGLNDDEVAKLKTQYRDEDEMTNAEMLEARASAICGEDYSTIFKATDDSGIFKCNNYTKAIYSISNPDRTEKNYKNIAFATFLGTDDDEIANEFFDNKLYIYQDYRYSGIPDQLILLFESSSEESLIVDNLDTIYNYVKKINEEYATDLILYIFYTEDLSQTNDLKDYVIISGVVGAYSWLPNGNGFGNYYYQEEKEITALKKLGENPDLYSSQTRDAIKFHRHIRAEINNGKDITKESLKQLLYDSFENGL
jgi:hypothetical protein